MFLKKLVWILTVIGGINWGLVGAFNFNLVTMLFGDASFLTSLVYILVGLSSIAMIFLPPCNN